MKFKLDEHGNIVLKDGLPVVVTDDGQEKPYDVLGKIGELNNESAKCRHEAEGFKTKLTETEGRLKPCLYLGTPKEIQVKLEHPAKSGAKDEQVKELQEQAAQLTTQVETLTGQNENLSNQIKTLTGENEGLQKDLYQLTVGNAFFNSTFIREKTDLPPDIMLATFGRHFKVEKKDGKRVIIPHNGEGSPIFSRNPERQSEKAWVDEALKVLVMARPDRNRILTIHLSS